MPKHIATVINVRQETSSVKVFSLKLSSHFVFKSGQFVMLTFLGYVDKTGKGSRRAYSIASAPHDKLLELAIKIHSAPSFSSELDKLKVGDTVEVDGPFGKFFVDETKPEILFIAGGTGIAPLISMIKYLCHLTKRPKMKLLFGIKHVSDIIYKKEIDDLKARSLLDVVYCLSQEKCEGFMDCRVTAVLSQHVNATQDVYLCGLPEFVVDVVAMLESLGVSKERIHKEQW